MGNVKKKKLGMVHSDLISSRSNIFFKYGKKKIKYLDGPVGVFRTPLPLPHNKTVIIKIRTKKKNSMEQ